MSFIAVKCPGCGYRCKVSANAPARITCGNCLTSIETGNIDHAEPIPVIPLAQATGFDGKANAALLLLLGALLIVGAASAIFAGNSPEWCIVLAAIAIIAVIMSAVLLIRQQLHRTPEVPHDPTPWRGGTLSYQSPIQSRRRSPLFGIAIGFGIVLLILLGVAFLILGTCAMIMSSALNYR